MIFPIRICHFLWRRYQFNGLFLEHYLPINTPFHFWLKKTFSRLYLFNQFVSSLRSLLKNLLRYIYNVLMDLNNRRSLIFVLNFLLFHCLRDKHIIFHKLKLQKQRIQDELRPKVFDVTIISVWYKWNPLLKSKENWQENKK